MPSMIEPNNGRVVSRCRSGAKLRQNETQRMCQSSCKNGAKSGMSATGRTERNNALVSVEGDFLAVDGLKGRPWFRHLIYAPGFYTGYGAKTLPGVREGIEEKRYQEAEKEITRVAQALQDYAAAIDSAAADLERAGR